VPQFALQYAFDALGVEITGMVNEQKPVGNYSMDWNASGLAVSTSANCKTGDTPRSGKCC